MAASLDTNARSRVAPKKPPVRLAREERRFPSVVKLG
jgi:hypothetical protein